MSNFKSPIGKEVIIWKEGERTKFEFDSKQLTTYEVFKMVLDFLTALWIYEAEK